MQFLLKLYITLLCSGFVGIFIWFTSTTKLYTPADDFGYYTGLVGGVMMLLLLIYSVIKRYHRQLAFLGAVSRWFLFHMTLGIMGPLLVYVHAKWHLKTTNATIAFYSMTLVFLSGIIGRYIYGHVYAKRRGHTHTLDEMRDDLNEATAKLRADLAREDVQKDRHMKIIQDLLVLIQNDKNPFHARIKIMMFQLESLFWPPVMQAVLPDVRRYVGAYLAMKEAGFWTKAFSYWHIIHIPFLFLMLGSGFYHVYAVHAY